MKIKADNIFLKIDRFFQTEVKTRLTEMHDSNYNWYTPPKDICTLIRRVFVTGPLNTLLAVGPWLVAFLAMVSPIWLAPAGLITASYVALAYMFFIMAMIIVIVLAFVFGASWIHHLWTSRKSKEPGVMATYIKAQKSKVCVLLEIENEKNS